MSSKDENKVWPDTVWRQSSFNEMYCECVAIIRFFWVVADNLTYCILFNSNLISIQCKYIYIKLFFTECLRHRHSMWMVNKACHYGAMLQRSGNLMTDPRWEDCSNLTKITKFVDIFFSTYHYTDINVYKWLDSFRHQIFVLLPQHKSATQSIFQ